MGSSSLPDFITHSFPGFLLIAFGTWWLILISSWTSIRKRLLKRQKYDEEDKSWTTLMKQRRLERCALPLPCKMVLVFSVEGILKMVSSIIGIIVTLGTKSKSVLEIQYATVYLFFGLSGFSDIISFFSATPPGIDYFCLALAFGIEGGVVYSQYTTPASLEDVSKNIHVCLILSCMFVTLAEMSKKRNFSLKLLRSYLTLVQGAWFVLAAFLIDTDQLSWLIDDNAENYVVWLSVFVSWICGVCFFYMLVVYMLWYAIARVCICCRVASLTRDSCNSNIYTTAMVVEDAENQAFADDF